MPEELERAEGIIGINVSGTQSVIVKENKEQDWKKEFHQKYPEDIRHGEAIYKGIGRMEFGNDHSVKEELITFIQNQINKAREEATKEEHDRWAYQKANIHDNRIREMEKQRIVEMIEKIINEREEDVYHGIAGISFPTEQIIRTKYLKELLEQIK